MPLLFPDIYIVDETPLYYYVEARGFHIRRVPKGGRL